MKFGKFIFIFMSMVFLIGAGCSRVPENVIVEIEDAGGAREVVEKMLPVNENPEEKLQEEPIVKEEVKDEPVIEEEPVVVEAPQPQIRTFDITAKQWEFVPATITVNEGDTVRLNVLSSDVDHGIAISAFGINQTVKAGETEHIEFVADKKGTYTIFCSIFCGSGHGSMKGTLIVQ